MEKLNVLNTKAVKRFVKNTSILFGLLVVLFYSFATLILFFGKDADGKVITLTWILAFFPVVSFIGFFCWMKLHYKRLHMISETPMMCNITKNVGVFQGITVETATDVNGLLELLKKDNNYIALICADENNGTDTVKTNFHLIRLKKSK
jgi:hypothetical protein